MIICFNVVEDKLMGSKVGTSGCFALLVSHSEVVSTMSTYLVDIDSDNEYSL